MSKASNYLENGVINYFFRNQSVTRPTNIYVALYKTNPTDANTGAEVTGGGYERQRVTMGAPIQNNDSAVTTNSARVEFPRATNNWGEITHFGIFDAKTGGNLLTYGVFNRPITIETDNQFVIDTNDLEITVA